MPMKKSQIYHTRKSTRHFLYSKAEAEGLDKTSIHTTARIDKTIQSVCPGLLTGPAFLDHASEQLASISKFAFLVLRIDNDAIADPEHPESDPFAIHREVARLFDNFCKTHRGSWGLVNSELFSAYFEGKTGPQCIELIEKLQDTLKKQTEMTASAGIAEYPTLSYQPSEMFANALKALDHAAFFGPNSSAIFDAVSLNISGDKMFDKGDIEGSISEFQEALKLDPSNINVHNSLGVCYGLMGEYEKAKREFNSAIKLNARGVMPWYNMGFVSMLSGDRHKALDLLLKANTINRDVFEVVFQTGRLLLEMEQPESGKKFLEHASLLDPESGAVFRYLGECYTKIGELDTAVAAYKKAIKQNPSDAASLSALGCLFDEQQENPEIALMFCRESVQLSPDNGLFRYRLGQLYLKQNRLQEALQEFKKADFLGQDVSAYLTQIQKQLPKAS
jgi:tetratricopeptide (TPR) repeat protein